MNTTASRWRSALVAAAVGLGGALAGYEFALWPAPTPAAPPAGTMARSGSAGSAMPAGAAPAGTVDAAPAASRGDAPPTSAGRRVLYWYDPMKPDQHFDRPGKSPFMDMALQPQYADDGAGPEAGTASGSGLHIDPAVTGRLGVRLARVTRGTLAAPVMATVGVQFNDRLVAAVQARAAGFVERAYAHAPGDLVAAGTALADLMLPEWAGAQSEFLAVKATGDTQLIDAARQRLRLLGMPEALVSRVEASGRPEATLVVTAPIAGVIQALDARAGMTVAAGAPLARINGLDSVWLEASVPEADAALVAPGMHLAASFVAWPGETFAGTVQAILPEANGDARTLRLRAEVGSHGGRLRPGMVGQALLQPRGLANMLLVPSEAVIRTGTRNLVMLAREGGHFEPVEVRLGTEGLGQVAVLQGLREGDQVVASGQFLIDSEASLKGVLARQVPAGAQP